MANSGAGKRRKEDALSAPWAVLLTPATSHTKTKSNSSDIGVLYTYKPLEPGTMRLLHLLPGDKGHGLRGVVVHASGLSSMPKDPYRALSYVWGVDKRTEQLLTPDGIIPITPSLSAALRHLRQSNTPLVLWVDAVCINQEDNAEKAQQIRLLPTLFQRAEFTYAFWAGHEGNFDAVMEMLVQVRTQARLQERKAEQELAPGNEDDLSEDEDLWSGKPILIPTSWRNGSIPLPDDPVWSSVEALFSLPWFQRAWIIQETVASADLRVVCGRSLVNWNHLQTVVEIVHHEAETSEHEVLVRVRSKLEPFMALAMQREWEARRYRWTLVSLLEHFRHAESTLRRDRFFALLGLASDANEPEFEPDYSSPLEAVVLRFSRVFVRQGRGMQLLYRAGLNSQSHRFPSWVPDWTQPRPGCLYESDQRAVRFMASGPRPQEAQIRGGAGEDELLVSGYIADVVDRVSISSNTEEEWKEYLAEIDTMIDEAALAVVPDDRDDLKWKVPIASAEYPKFSSLGSLGLKPSYKALRNFLSMDQAGDGADAHEASSSLAQYRVGLREAAVSSLLKQSVSYTSVLRDTVAGWRFVVTRNGYVGVAPGLTKVGDVVTIMKGGLVPFVLREGVDRLGAFRLVGECYVHGLMHGEGLYNAAERDFCLY